MDETIADSKPTTIKDNYIRCKSVKQNHENFSQGLDEKIVDLCQVISQSLRRKYVNSAVVAQKQP